MDSMLTLDEVKKFLEIDQKQLEYYLKQRKLNAYKVGGSYIRFRKEEALNLRHEILPASAKTRVSLWSKIMDFWRFNNFYIIAILIVIVLAFLMIRT